MDKLCKKEVITKLNKKFLDAKSGILADFTGMNVKEMETLRGGFRSGSVDYHVVKNTLVFRASQGTAFEKISEKLVGPISVAISYDDVVAPAKIISEFNKENNDKLKVVCGVMEGKAVTPEQIGVIANLPSKDVLISKMLCSMKAPVGGFVGTLSGVLRNFVGVLTSIKDKKEGA